MWILYSADWSERVQKKNNQDTLTLFCNGKREEKLNEEKWNTAKGREEDPREYQRMEECRNGPKVFSATRKYERMRAKSK
ncbi:hypothetical protein RUM44_000133 [Polyplax serrata]|uniref:Uncharacterized protein n=1 Tax=Polyplax serrata TaxID=468196 RepID=A0ABR1B676_POLSC